MIPRQLEHTVRRAIKSFPAVLVTGPRQSGKTTLLKERFSETHAFVSLEDPDVRDRALDDPRGFLRDNPPPVILDEIQYTPELLHYIKTAIDEDRAPGKWLLSGSQHFSLMSGVSQSLSGRVAVLALLPFSLAESVGEGSRKVTVDEIICRAFGDFPAKAGATGSTGLDMSAGKWLLSGAYPEVRANPEVDRHIWCSSYIQTYLERDVRQIMQVSDLNLFNRFLRICAARTAQVLNMSEIARDVGVSVTTVKKWISVLEASYQIFLLPPYFHNFGKRLIKSPKLYFLDTGIAAYLTGIHDVAPLASGPMMGPLFETMVVSEWVKTFYHAGEKPELYYYRAKSGLEVDLIIDRNSRLYPMEIKSTATILPRHGDNPAKWIALAGDESARGLIIADVDQPVKIKDCNVISWKNCCRTSGAGKS